MMNCMMLCFRATMTTSSCCVLRSVQMEEAERSAASAQQEEHVCSALKNVFGAKGVQHFVLDGVVHDLSTYTRNYLKTLLPAFQLDLHMTQVHMHIQIRYSRAV